MVIDAFRTINPQSIAMNQEPRQTTSNLGHLQKPSIQALIHGLNRHYYSIPINYRTHELEQKVSVEDDLVLVHIHSFVEIFKPFDIGTLFAQFLNTIGYRVECIRNKRPNKTFLCALQYI